MQVGSSAQSTRSLREDLQAPHGHRGAPRTTSADLRDTDGEASEEVTSGRHSEQDASEGSGVEVRAVPAASGPQRGELSTRGRPHGGDAGHLPTAGRRPD